MASLYAELKRRNVIRVVLAYIVVGWIVLQVADIVAPALSLPDWTLPFLILVGACGLPFAIIFAWAFELTPEGLKRTEEVSPEESITDETASKLNGTIIAVLAIAVVLLVAERIYNPAADATGDANTAPEADDGMRSIAVLPFVNMSNDPEQEYFSDGISEELLNALAKIQDLRVAARTSSFAFKGKNQDITEIGAALNVNTVLEGSVRKSGQRLRITAQLIDVNNGYHLWSETYDRDLTDIFAVQDEISAAIIDALQIHLGTGDEIAAVRRTGSLEAYDLYLEGRHVLRQRGERDIEQALALFEAATALDPSFAEAWAGQAMAVTLLHTNFDRPRRAALEEADGYVDRALSLQPSLAEAYAVRGLIQSARGDNEAAIVSHQKALSLKPNLSIVLMWQARNLMDVGRYAEGTSMLDRAAQLDPLHPLIQANRAAYLLGLDYGRVAELLADTPRDNALAVAPRGRLARETGHWAESYRILGQSPREGLSLDNLHFAVTEFFYLANPAALATAPPSLRCRMRVLANRYEDVIAEAESWPPDTDDPRKLLCLGLARYEIGDHTGALAALNRINATESRVNGEIGLPWSGFNLAILRAGLHKELGQNTDALDLAREAQAYLDLHRQNGLSAYYLRPEAALHMVRDEPDLAMKALEQAVEKQEFTWSWARYPLFRPLRGRQDFRALLNRVETKLNAERAELGWPPVAIDDLL